MLRPPGMMLLSLCILSAGCVTSFDFPAHIDSFAILSSTAQGYYRDKGQWPRSARELMAWTVAESDHPATDFTPYRDLTVQSTPNGNLVMRWVSSPCTIIEFRLSKPSPTTAPATRPSAQTQSS
jgi:hypothetical protein